jgi:glycosyltransferase involved in cell wall biosynthesis
MDYWIVLLTRDGKTTITGCIESILKQTTQPALTCIIDDGSTDGTSSIVKKYAKKHPKKIHVVTLPDRGFDIRRVVHNLNLATKTVRRLKTKTKYHMITGDDCLYPADYCERILGWMEKNPKLVVASGDIEGSIPDVTPRGSGRFIRNDFFERTGGEYPPYYGYEGWILYKALQLGYEIRNFSKTKYKHLRTMGTRHRFRSWGLAMRCLGYNPLEVIYRFVKYVLVDRSLPVSYFRVLWDYFIKSFTLKNDPYFHYFDEDLRKFIDRRQKRELIKHFKNCINFTRSINEQSL